MTCRILLVDRSPIFHLGFASILKGTPFHLPFATDSVVEAVDRLNEANRSGSQERGQSYEAVEPIDLVVCEFTLPDGNSQQLQVVANRHQIPLALMTDRQHLLFTSAMVAAGAKGLIPKSQSVEQILKALESLAAGESLWERKDIRRFTGAHGVPQLEGHIEFPLTQREFEVLKHVASGKTNKMIAEALGIGYETVKEHVQKVLLKLGVNDRTQAAVFAVRRGII